MDLLNLHKTHPFVYQVIMRKIAHRFARELLVELDESGYIGVCSTNAANEPQHVTDCATNDALKRRGPVAIIEACMAIEGFHPALQDEGARLDAISAVWDIWNSQPLQTLMNA